MSEDGACAARFLCALLATVVKPISDLRLLISGLCALLFGLCVPVAAQQPAKVPRIAWLTGGNMPPDRMEAFRLGLRELGYIEGKNITIEWRCLRRDNAIVSRRSPRSLYDSKSTSFSPVAPLTLAAQKPRRRPSQSS
jgi:hypothetical protein